MSTITFDLALCGRCGICSQACYSGRITRQSGLPKWNNENCRECFHCVAACPTGAASVGHLDHEMRRADTPLLSRRSCRAYTEEPVDRDTLAIIARLADQAPRMSPPGARRYVFVQNLKTLASLRTTLAAAIRKAHGLFRLACRLPLPKSAKDALRRYRDVFGLVQRRIDAGGDIFHGAPVLALITGSRREGMMKEDGVYAMQQLMLAAASRGLGSCVNGFASSFAGATARVLSLPKGHRVWAAATLGLPRIMFRRAVLRKDLDLQWVT